MKTNALHVLAQRLAKHDGVTDTSVAGVQLYRLSRPSVRSPAVFTPRVCFNVIGSKRVFHGGRSHVYDENHFLCCTLPLPVEADVPRASTRNPVIGVSLELDEQALTEVALALPVELENARTASAGPVRGIAIGRWDEPLRQRVADILSLAEDTAAGSVLGPGRVREVYYLLLQGETGPLLRQRFGAAGGVVKAVTHMRENLSESLAVEDLAKKAGMSRASFHRNFKKMTGQSPLQLHQVVANERGGNTTRVRGQE